MMKLQNIHPAPELQDILFLEESPTDQTELADIEFGYQASQLHRQVFGLRLRESFRQWLQAFILEAESKSEKKLAKRLLGFKQLSQIENFLFRKRMKFQGKKVNSLKDTVVAQAYTFLFRREKADMQLPSKLDENRLDRMVDNLFFSPDELGSNGFSLCSLLKKLVAPKYLSRSVASAEMDTLLLYLSGFCHSEVKREQLRSRLERTYRLLLGLRVVHSHIDNQLERLKEAPRILGKARDEMELAVMDCRRKYEYCDFLEKQCVEKQLEQERQQESQSSGTFADGLGNEFSNLKEGLVPSQSTPEVEKLFKQIAQARHSLVRAEMTEGKAEESYSSAKQSFLDTLRYILQQTPSELTPQYPSNSGFSGLANLQYSIDRGEVDIFSLLEELQTPQIEHELEQLRFQASQFSLKPLDLLFFLRLDELEQCQGSRFERLSLAYTAVLYDFMRVKFFGKVQVSLNRLFASQYEVDDRSPRLVDLDNILNALIELYPDSRPLLERTSLSLRQARRTSDDYEIEYNKLFTLFECLLLVTGGFFDTEEGRFVCVGKGGPFLNVILHNLAYLVCERKARDFLGRVRKCASNQSDLLKATYSCLQFPTDIPDSMDIDRLTQSLQSVMGAHGSWLVSSLLTRNDLKRDDQPEWRAAYKLHPKKRWKVNANSLGEICKKGSLGVGGVIKLVLSFVFLSIPKSIYSTSVSGWNGFTGGVRRLLRFILRAAKNSWKGFWKSALGSWVKFLFWLSIAFLLYRSAIEEQWIWKTWGLEDAKTFSETLFLIFKGLKYEFNFLF